MNIKFELYFLQICGANNLFQESSLVESRSVVIDFEKVIACRRRQKVIPRHQQLISLVDLERFHFDLFDMPGIKDYYKYIRCYGLRNARQVVACVIAIVIS